MGIRSLSTASISTGSKRSKFWDQSAAFGGDYESIATVTIGAGGAANAVFTSIPTTYKHLQIRMITRGSVANTSSNARIRLNSGTDYSNYYLHGISGNGSSPGGGGYDGANGNILSWGTISNTSMANLFTGVVMDILDYSNTSKFKIVRSFYGHDINTAGGVIGFSSTLYRSTSAITSLTIDNWDGGWTQHSSFALYGVK
jgi:hypothetical protein